MNVNIGLILGMVIYAKDAEAGRRYRCVDTGDVVEICARPQDSRNGVLVPLTTADGSFIHVNAVSFKNHRIKEKDPSKPLALPSFYKLEAYDGPYTKEPTRRVVIPKPQKTSREGRPKKGETPWRGWAAHARYDMERILEVVEDEGCWITETFHYFRVGYKAETGLGVFKAGQLGFHSRPTGQLGQFPEKPKTTDPYMPWKVELGTVMAAEEWDTMLDLVRRFLREFKQKIDKRKRR